MTHPVPPPEPPAIIQHLPPKTLPAVGNRVNPPLVISQSVTAKPSSSPPTVNAAKNAALLGSEMAVGYSVEQFEITSLDDTGFTQAATPVNSNQQSNSSLSRDRAIAAPKKAMPTAKTPFYAPSTTKRLRTSLAQSNRQPISPFRPSTSTRVNKLLVSQVAAPETAPSDRTDSNNVSEPSNSQPVELNFQAPRFETQPPRSPIPNQQRQPTTQSPSQPSQPSPPPGTAPAKRRIIEVSSDRQEYDALRQIVTAEGNVVVRLDDAVLDADRLQVSLPNLIAVGEGDVAFTRGQQRLRGQRFTYNIVQNSGNFQNGRGEIYIPTASSDFSNNLATDVTAGSILSRPPSDRLSANQPLQQVTSAGGINFAVGGGGRNVSNLPRSQQGGDVRRLRFEANQIDFYPEGWQAKDVRITNDPFSPPELELRADTVTLTRETPLRDRIRTTRQRLVFDQGLSVPIPRNEAVIDRNERDVNPGLAQFGFDGTDRGGLYIERGFSLINSNAVQLNLQPQFFVQKAVDDNGGNPLDPSLFGLRANLRATPGERTALTGNAVFTSLDLGDVEDNLRASLRLQQLVGTRLPHTASLEYTYRERIYNGTLGYRTVQSSVGALVTSPIIRLGKTGINLSYQAGAQYINADTDRLELLEPVRENNRASLNRFQGSVALNRGFLLWRGKGLPATAKEGLRYTPAPVVPYLAAFAGVTGTSSFYSNGDNQNTLIGTIGLEGQLGHFSRPFFDYTRFNISYSEGIRNGISPFLFDRAADTRVVSFGLTQQLYGPLRLGFQTAVNLDTNDRISTDYTLEYSRRTYGIVLRYNPELEIGSIGLRISDFNWTGGTDPFSDSEIRPVVGGVKRINE
jgi:hypothetical protein